MQQLQILSSHKHPIKQLMFSPWPMDGPENNPIILVSLSEQMCFWNIKYVINNPLEGKKKSFRRSSRFSKELTWTLDGDTATDNESNTNGLKNGKATNGRGRSAHIEYWDDKAGASDKLELLACIKFVGNSATKLVTNAEFDKFITIDNEGDIYALQTTRPAVDEIDTAVVKDWPVALTKRISHLSLGNTLTVSS